MLNLISLLIGLIALPFTLVAVLPALGWANWLILPVPLFGLAVGVLSRGQAGRNLNLLVVAIAVVRLLLGHGLF